MCVRLFALLAMFMLMPGSAMADVVVIANPKCGVERLTREEVVNIFLGRFRQFPSGITAQPTDLPPSQAERAIFYRQLVNKELPEINSYWARLVFSGRTTPPRQATGNDDVIHWVSANIGGIAYVERTKTDSRVKIVYEFAN